MTYCLVYQQDPLGSSEMNHKAFYVNQVVNCSVPDTDSLGCVQEQSLRRGTFLQPVLSNVCLEVLLRWHYLPDKSCWSVWSPGLVCWVVVPPLLLIKMHRVHSTLNVHKMAIEPNVSRWECNVAGGSASSDGSHPTSDGSRFGGFWNENEIHLWVSEGWS